MELDEFRDSLDEWLAANGDALRPDREGTETLDGQVSQLARVKRATYEAGWMRWGWPERVGGFGGSTLHRAYLGEALTARELVEPGIYSMTEVLAPTMIDFAPPELAAAMIPRLLCGDETWCQGFSEPGTGSNLAALTCRATRGAAGWRVTGQKVWTSLAQYAQRCILLTRTGPPESARAGITALFVDMESPGITVRPIQTMHGLAEFCEVFFDDVTVPFGRTLGDVDLGWSIAQSLLPFERSTALWHRGSYLHNRLEQLLVAASPGSIDAAELGNVYLQLFALRARSRTTQHRLASGNTLGPETSIDKVMVSTLEQALFDMVPDALPHQLLAGHEAASSQWRAEYLYSRAATIYGGSVEIQRNIIARKLLDLGSDL
jgi:alkylation response protein AidB-like acyl-CoA dehydrogenase